MKGFIYNEKLYNEIATYIEFLYIMNLDKDKDFDFLEEIHRFITMQSLSFNIDLNYHNSKLTSNSLKLICITRFYEYINYYYYNNKTTNKERDIFLLLENSKSIKSTLDIYDQDYDTILTTFIKTVPFSNDQIDILRTKIIHDNKLKNIFKLYPPSIFDYRFLFGFKFDFENITSVCLIKHIVEVQNNLIKVQNNPNDKSIDRSKLNIQLTEDIVGYICSNIYEHLLIDDSQSLLDKNSLNKKLKILTTKELFDWSTNNLQITSNLLNTFYIYNSKTIGEQHLLNLRQNTEKNGEIKLIKKLNPYYDEESLFFNNMRK